MRSKEVEEKIVFLKELLKLNERMFEEVGSGLFHKNISKAIDTVLSYISELEKENAKYKNFQLHINGMRSGKELLIKYINDSVLKEDIRDKINNMFELYHERYELDFEEVRELISEIHRKVLKELEGE